MSKINFFTEDISFILKHKTALRAWIHQVIKDAGQRITSLNYIYCSDKYLLQVNKDYLNHDYYTDIITFDNRDDTSSPIDADIFISIDRVVDNAQSLETSIDRELYRVMIHGVLHLLGSQDQTDEQKKEMRKSEEASLSLLNISNKH